MSSTKSGHTKGLHCSLINIYREFVSQKRCTALVKYGFAILWNIVMIILL